MSQLSRVLWRKCVVSFSGEKLSPRMDENEPKSSDVDVETSALARTPDPDIRKSPALPSAVAFLIWVCNKPFSGEKWDSHALPRQYKSPQSTSEHQNSQLHKCEIFLWQITTTSLRLKCELASWSTTHTSHENCKDSRGLARNVKNVTGLHEDDLGSRFQLIFFKLFYNTLEFLGFSLI